MTIQVLLFAGIRQAVGHDAVDVELADTATVADLRAALMQRFPKLASLLDRSAFAVNEAYADDATALMADATVACIPPVSGG